MSKLSMPSLPIALAGTLVAVAAWAASPHFIKATGAIDNDGNYVASFKEAGLGAAGSTVTYNLTVGTAQFTYQCFTKKGNTPQGSPNGVFSSNLTTTGTLPVGRNGQITGSLTIEPTPPAPGCQGAGLKLCLTQASYETVVLTDTTNNVAVSLPDDSKSFSPPKC